MAPTGRFAPSPSGRMHLGNMFTALASWLSARSRGGRWILRIEDLDPQRSRPEYARMIEDDLRWLGLDWDEGGLSDRGPSGPYSQSRRHGFYSEALEKLSAMGLTYGCRCRRADILASRAPHQSDGPVVYAGTCRPLPSPPFREGRVAAGCSTRIYVPAADICFDDGVYGPQCFNLERQCGDFILRRSDGEWAYQLAVVVDDALMGVTEVVRGCDLLQSTACQLYLFRLLGYPEPEYIHLPLLCNSAGQRLSKRDGSLSMEALRRSHAPSGLLRLLAAALGLRIPAGMIPGTPYDLLPYFSFDSLREGTPRAILPDPGQLAL